MAVAFPRLCLLEEGAYEGHGLEILLRSGPASSESDTVFLKAPVTKAEAELMFSPNLLSPCPPMLKDCQIRGKEKVSKFERRHVKKKRECVKKRKALGLLTKILKAPPRVVLSDPANIHPGHVSKVTGTCCSRHDGVSLLLPRLKCSGAISARCDLHLPGLSNSLPQPPEWLRLQAPTTMAG
ncbi:hypothetical protein AAY473_031213 [Plecturocebus cupreus]